MPPLLTLEPRSRAGLVRLALTLRFARLYVESRVRTELVAIGAGAGLELDLPSLELLLAGCDAEGAAALLAEAAIADVATLDQARLRLFAVRIALADATAGLGSGHEQAVVASRLLIARAAELASVGFADTAH